MWAHERQNLIFASLAQKGRVETNQIAADLNVSRETIRRDFLEMERNGLLQRVHGGVIPSSTTEPEPSFGIRREQYADLKESVGRLALDLIPEGTTCFIDAGTTTSAFARHLAQRGQVRVITNSYEIARIMLAGHDCETLLLGGTPHPDVPATYGELTLSEIDRFWADYAVISPVALNAQRGATNYQLHEAEIARAMIRHSKTNIFLCHSAKLNVENRVTICRLDEIDHLVTDSLADPIPLPNGTTHYADIAGGMK